MSELLNRFKICSKISEEIKQNIKIFHVFNDKNGKNILFITSDDKVFGFGYNTYGCCGLGHDRDVNEPQIIPELCHKNMQQFFIGWTFILCLTSDKHVYGWGCNDQGQLGREYNCSKYFFKPKIIEFSSERVEELSCGYRHCLALTEEGKVYGWGSNENGQIGCGKEKGNIITSPLHLGIFPQFSVKKIHCFGDQSYALTTNGLVYSWGYNYVCSLGHELDANECVYDPKQILNIPKIISICHSSDIFWKNTYFLTNEKELYFCGYFNDATELSIQKLPKLLNKDLKFTSLFTFCFLKCVAICDKKVFELFMNRINETKYNSLFDYCFEKKNICYETIHINSDQYFVGNDLKYLQNFIKVFDKSFIECEKLGSGGFGEVFKVKNKFNLDFAVKKIYLNGKNTSDSYMRAIPEFMSEAG